MVRINMFQMIFHVINSSEKCHLKFHIPNPSFIQISFLFSSFWQVHTSVVIIIITMTSISVLIFLQKYLYKRIPHEKSKKRKVSPIFGCSWPSTWKVILSKSFLLMTTSVMGYSKSSSLKNQIRFIHGWLKYYTPTSSLKLYTSHKELEKPISVSPHRVSSLVQGTLLQKNLLC